MKMCAEKSDVQKITSISIYKQNITDEIKNHLYIKGANK